MPLYLKVMHAQDFQLSVYGYYLTLTLNPPLFISFALNIALGKYGGEYFMQKICQQFTQIITPPTSGWGTNAQSTRLSSPCRCSTLLQQDKLRTTHSQVPQLQHMSEWHLRLNCVQFYSYGSLLVSNKLT